MSREKLAEPCKSCQYGDIETDRREPCSRCVNAGNGGDNYFRENKPYQTRSDVAEVLETVGDGFFFLNFAKAADMPDDHTRRAFSKAVAALKEFRRLVNPCGSLDLSNSE